MRRFIRLWKKAQQAKDVEEMEAFLRPRWLNHWWYAHKQASGTWKTDTFCTIEMILQRAGLIGTPPQRPSERAMEEADKICPTCGVREMDKSGWCSKCGTRLCRRCNVEMRRRDLQRLSAGWQCPECNAQRFD